MRKLALTVTIGAALISAGAVAVAQEARHPAVAARTSIMQLYQNSLMTLGAMAKGKMEYDAELAKGLANNLALLLQVNMGAAWPQGSDNKAYPGKTTALPKIWTTYPEVAEYGKNMANFIRDVRKELGVKDLPFVIANTG